MFANAIIISAIPFWNSVILEILALVTRRKLRLRLTPSYQHNYHDLFLFWWFTFSLILILRPAQLNTSAGIDLWVIVIRSFHYDIKARITDELDY